MGDSSEAMLLVINAGSSSIKFSLYTTDRDALHRLSCGQFSGFGGVVHFQAKTDAGTVLTEQQMPALLHAQAIDILLKWTADHYPDYRLTSAGHRVVHGGVRYSAPVVIDDVVLAEIRRLIPLAPLHQPHHVNAIEALKKRYPDLIQVACFDTAFHHTNAKVATTYAIPRALTEQGVRRYGFHGLANEYIASVMASHLGPTLANGRIVIAHLGAGASMCALNEGRSVTSTMGFMALDGLKMNKRCGSPDPGVILYLIQEKKMNAEQIAQFLYNDWGVRGVSGFSDDMKVLAAGWLGVQIDHNSNAAINTSPNGGCISSRRAPVSAWVIPTNEDLMIAQHTQRLLSAT